jgi:hypothetical protein
MFFAVETEWFTGRNFVTPASAAVGVASHPQIKWPTGWLWPTQFFFFFLKIKKKKIKKINYRTHGAM